MNFKKELHILLFAAVLAPFVATAQRTVAFDFTQIPDESTTYTDTVDGLTMNLATSDDWNGDGNPGVIAYGDPVGLAVVSDANSFGYSITFTFDQDIQLNSCTPGLIDSGLTSDPWQISFESGGTTHTYYPDLRATLVGNSYNFGITDTITAGTAITFTNNLTGSSALFLSDLKVKVIPESNTYALLFASAGFVFLMFRHKRLR